MPRDGARSGLRPVSEAWFHRGEGGPVGPVAEAVLLRLVRTGTITSTTPLRREGAADESPAAAAIPRAFIRPPAYAGPLRGVWTDVPPHPWRRFLARFLDIAIVGDTLFSVLSALLQVVAPIDEADMSAFLDTRIGTALEFFLASLLVLPANAALMARFGTTLGKRAFSIRILKDGARLDVRTALRRELLAWRRGQALGLPLVDFFAMAGAYHDLKAHGTTRWDADLGLRVSYKTMSRLTLAGLVLAVLLIAALVVLTLAL